MALTKVVLEKVKELVAPLAPAERRQVIRALEEMALESAESDGDAKGGEADPLAEEQEAWFAQPQTVRRRYSGEFVAVYNREVVDHDPNKRALYIRVRERFGRTPVLIVPADWDEPPRYQIHSPRLER